MDNLTKSKTWLKMAEEDYKDALVNLEHERFPSAVFHSQQCCEKVGKALLIFFGIGPPKTYFPSYELKWRVLRGNKYKLRVKQHGVLEKIIALSTVLEGQREFPRYGWETKDRIVPPSEIYDGKKAKTLAGNAAEVLKLAKNFLKQSK